MKVLNSPTYYYFRYSPSIFAVFPQSASEKQPIPVIPPPPPPPPHTH